MNDPEMMSRRGFLVGTAATVAVGASLMSATSASARDMPEAASSSATTAAALCGLGRG